MSTATPSAPMLQGTLHMYVAFDWGDEILLDRVREIVPASAQELPRRRRTPPSFFYRPPPLRVVLPSVELQLAELGAVQASVVVTIFDFGAVSIAFQISFSAAPEALLSLAGSLADSTPLLQKAKTTIESLHKQLLPAIQDPLWQDDLSEEYHVFQFAPEALPQAANLAWLAGMVHLESDPLSADEMEEALRFRLSYSPEDLFVPDWAAAVLIDRDCDDTLQTIGFANLQLLEFRHIDNRLDESLQAAAHMIQPLTRSTLPYWRVHDRPLRVLGELKVEANGLFERTNNVLKLVGDPYLARVYRLVARRFHMETWIENIQRKLEVAEGVYQVVSDQATSFRTEFLEVIVVLLILIEIILAFVHR
ncbi:MAG: hypothetical protein HYR84_01315 [Planctomycetes bacterium]|nr:hypothetical protein [Planctomycetota bacterium]